MAGASLLPEILAAMDSGQNHVEDILYHCLATTDLDRLAETAGMDVMEYLLFEIEGSDRLTVTYDDHVVRLDELANGLVFTHRLTESELAGDMVEMNPDLAALDLGTAELSTPAGPVTLEFDFQTDSPYSEHGSWQGPPGWLSGFAPGDLAAFRRDGDGVIVEAAGELADGDAEVAEIAQAFFDLVSDGAGEEPWIVLEEAITANPALFRRPVPPVSDLLTDAGLEPRGAFIGPADEIWDPPGVVAERRVRETLAARFHFEACCEEALDNVIEGWHDTQGGGHLDVRSLNRALGHGSVADAFGDWLDHSGMLGWDKVGEFASRLATPGRRHNGGAHLLMARHLDSVGEVVAAEAALEEAIRSDPEFEPALVELARYASDRGDAERVVSLLRRAGFAADHPLVELHASLSRAFPQVGRNDPCPCGSGRKYKQCHLGRAEVPTRERVTWLISKLTMYVTRPEWTPRLLGLAVSAMWEDFEFDDLARMRSDELIVELAVFDAGGIDEYLDHRGPLLPADEVEILDEWRHVQLRLWEVTATDGVSSITVRDTGNGDTHTTTDVSSATRFRPGDQVATHLLPAWGEMWLPTVLVPVPLQHRDRLRRVLDDYPDADSLASWYGGLHAPPRMANRDGEPMVLHEVHLRPTSGWDQLVATLDSAYEPDESDFNVWREMHPIDEDESIVRATLRRDEDDLVVDVNSDARLERVLDVLDPVAEVVSQTRNPATTMRQVKEAFANSAPSDEPAEPLPPEFMAEIRDRYERRWLDQEIPALGGITPRQAAADPTRRPDLVALLRSFEDLPANPDVAMRPDVLRRELGISE